MRGELRFYDDASRWGVILGEDGCLYMLRAGDVPAPAPRVGEKVAFEPAPGPGGLRASTVRRLG